MGQGQKGKRPPTYGPQVKARVERLLEALLSYFNQEVEGCEHLEIESNWQTDNQVVVRTKSGTLEKLTGQDSYSGKLTKGQIGEALHKYLGSFLGILEDQRTQTKGSEDLHFTLKLWHGRDKNKNLAQFHKEWDSRRSKKSKAQEIALTSISQKPIALNKPLEPQLEQTLKLYLAKSFNDDGFAELDQAGETEPERRTLLKQVFIDLDLAPCKEQRPQDLELENPLSPSAMRCLLNEYCLKVVIIGGPGQGKSTLGQQLAQIHRAKLLGKPYDFEPRIERIPLRVVLKYFAQWLADNPALDDLEFYLAERIGKLAARAGTIFQKDIQEILRCRPCLLILDGLDEVVVPELQEIMLARIQDFLDRAEQLSANLMVVATSRPKEYKERYEKYFEPELFWHLELQRLSPEKVIEYSRKWVPAKNLREEEQHRILRTLEECQQDRSISALLTTPLQVTIILLIIKDGGRPPSHREALFDEYWRIIFRREKSKAKGIIQSDESILFELHSYLGYLLHHRASQENVQSLLPEEEFKLATRKFLRKEDSRSSEDAIDSKIKQLVGEAQERLVLIVAPEPGLFGFELRSFQEFFAAVHLAQTASDTQQRFERLKAIACSEHWRNVALFFAGRIVRNFKGEASNILELVCRTVDRGEPNRYLRPGCWLALEIAVDGALSTNRDLQYNAVEYGLEVLETGLTEKQQEYLSSLTQRLSEEDQHDILRPVLSDKLQSLPIGCLEAALNLYIQHFKPTPLFLDKIDTLLQTHQKNTVLSALNLALRCKLEPLWMMERLQLYWDYWKEDIQEVCVFQSEPIWFDSPDYTESLFRVWQLSEVQATKLANVIYESYFYNPDSYSIDLDLDLHQEFWLNISKPNTFSEQLIIMLNSNRIMASIKDEAFPGKKFNFSQKNCGFRITNFEAYAPLVIPQSIRQGLDALLQYSNLSKWLRVSLWELFWLINPPNADNVSVFIESFLDNQEMSVSNEEPALSFHNLLETWPILGLIIKNHKNKKLDIVNNLMPFVASDIQISIAKIIANVIQLYIEQGKANNNNTEYFLLALLALLGLDEFLPQLSPLVNSMGIICEELLNPYIEIYTTISYLKSDIKIEGNLIQIKKIIGATIEAIKHSKKDEFLRLLWSLRSLKIPDDPDVLRQIQQLLELILESYSKSSDFSFAEESISLFIKFLAYETQGQQIGSRFLATLSPDALLRADHWEISDFFDNRYLERLSALASYLNHEVEAVRIGGAILLKKLIESARHYPQTEGSKLQELRNLCSDTEKAWSLANCDNSSSLVGITLLYLSDHPIENINYRYRFLTALQQSRIANQEVAWVQLLKEMPMPKEKHVMWRSLLEEILGKPWNYSSLALSAAMERYQTLASAASPTISEAKEKELGLL